MLEKYIQNKLLKDIAEWILCLIIGFLLYMVLNTFVFGIASISGSSMEPTLTHNDKVVMNKFTYLFSDPKQGDIVAFPYRGNPEEAYVKRIVGMPGDVIEIIDGRFAVNGEIPDDIFSEEIILSYGNLNYPFEVPEGGYFVLGDNRNHSSDSRNSSVGCITKKEFIGKISLRLFPLNTFGPLE